MPKEKPNKWTRERSYWEENGGDILVWVLGFMFLTLSVGGFAVILFHPHIPGLSELFSSPPAVQGPPPDRKLHLAPGETEIKLYPKTPAKPVAPPPPQPGK